MDLIPLVDELKTATAWQRTPQAILHEDYVNMIVNGIKYLYLITGRGDAFDPDMIGEDDDNLPTFTGTLSLTEQMIVVWAAQISLYERVRADKNSIVGYTTDALTVTNADKPYRYLSETIEELRRNIRAAYYKLISYVGD